MTKLIRTVIADEDQQFVTKLVNFFQKHPKIQIVGTAVDGPGAVEVCAETLPDVVVVHLGLPVIDGIKTTQNILSIGSQIGVLVIACTEADDYALQAIKMGARGYLLKSDSLETIAEVIGHVYEGDVHIPSDLASLMLNEFDRLS